MRSIPALPALLLGLLALPASAQIDPKRRQLIQMGFNQALDGRGPLAGYLYYYLNQPRFPRPNQTLRLAVAPVYVDSELGLLKALGPKTDLGLGLGGGGFADGYNEFRRGVWLRGESFRGDGVGASVSAYHAFAKVGLMPLAGVLRLEARHALYSVTGRTEPGFAVPRDQTEYSHRLGLRLGGIEPVLLPAMAAELSAWHEGRYRSAPGTYGYDGDRRVEAHSQLLWARAVLVYNRPQSRNRFVATLTGGEIARADRLSAFRLGGALPHASEFPLSLPGYYHQEISARRYVLLGGSYIVPLSADKRTWAAELMAANALVAYPKGLEQKGKTHTGVGAGLSYLSRSNAWKISGSYGYAVDASRRGRRGGQTVGLLVQLDFERADAPFFSPATPVKDVEQMLRRGLRKE